MVATLLLAALFIPFFRLNLRENVGGLVLFFYLSPISLGVYILYFINFYFLQRLVKDKNTTGRWYLYRYMNLAACLSIVFLCLLFAYDEGGGFDGGFRIGANPMNENLFFIILTIVLVLPFWKVHKKLKALDS